MKWLLCKLGRHDLQMSVAAVQGVSLCYSRATPAQIVARFNCARANCDYHEDRAYQVGVILQKAKRMQGESR